LQNSSNNSLSDIQATHFFLGPEAVRQRQYEALRAYFLDNGSAADVAERFGYTVAAFRSLAHRFRHDPALRTV
jgi:DNA-directed RNA polymerase specialized sigma24 family protein